MRYYDTSALMSLLVPDVHTKAAMYELEADGGRISSSNWASVELKSALAKEVRTGSLTPGKAISAWQRYELWCLPGGGLRLHGFAAGVFALAALSIRIDSDGAGNLRAGDALHIAAAESSAATGFVTADRAQASASSARGQYVVLLPRQR